MDANVRYAGPFRKLSGFEAGPVIQAPLKALGPLCVVMSSCASKRSPLSTIPSAKRIPYLTKRYYIPTPRSLFLAALPRVFASPQLQADGCFVAVPTLAANAFVEAVPGFAP
jgi:hypothetical protein